jgi:O-antigen/teichoic acid export membrane protein
MGAYSAATQWRQILLFLPGLVAQVVLPIMASQAGRLPASRQIRANLLVNLALALPILIVLCLLSPFIMRAYGNDFRNGWLMFAIVQCAAFFQVLQSPVITWWAASGRMWINFFTNLCWSGTLVFLSWRFIEWGAQGLAVASLISFGVFGILMWIVVTKFMDLHAGAGR